MRDVDIIKALRDKADRHRKLSDVYARTADTIEDETNTTGGAVPYNADEAVDEAVDDNRMRRTNYTYKEALLKILDDNRPRTSRELLDDYNSLTNKLIRYNSFSGLLSTFIKRHGLIRKYEIDTNPINKRFYYGLTQWFEGNDLKKKFCDKIKT